MADYNSDNIFAQIIRGELPCDPIYQDDDILAFPDINPAAPIHILVIPKGEYVSFHDFNTQATPEKILHFFKKLRDIAHEQGLEESGYRIIMNHGPDSSQMVPHFHAHILGGKKLGPLIAGDQLNR